MNKLIQSKKLLLRKQEGRRRMMTLLAFGGSTSVAALSNPWSRPEVNSIMLPAHALVTDGSFRMTCEIQGPNTISALGTANILLTISPNPESVLSIEAVGVCEENLVFNVTSTLDFTNGQAEVTIGPLAPPPTCNPGDMLTVSLSVSDLDDVNERCEFIVI